MKDFYAIEIHAGGGVCIVVGVVAVDGVDGGVDHEVVVGDGVGGVVDDVGGDWFAVGVGDDVGDEAVLGIDVGVDVTPTVASVSIVTIKVSVFIF